MSELKTYDVLMTPSDNGAWVLKSAADKVIANRSTRGAWQWLNGAILKQSQAAFVAITLL